MWEALLYAHLRLPDWIQAPGWLIHLSHDLRAFILAHQATGLFTVILAEEMGIPLPVPGDVAIMWGGYMTTINRLAYPLAYVCVIAGATAGGTCLFTLGRRYGHRLLFTYGRYIGLQERHLERAQAMIMRWGPWAVIIGRLIPGMRIWLSAVAGSFQMRYRVFVPSVMVSSAIWAAIFVELGRRLGPRANALFRLVPAHLLPWLLLVVLVAAVVVAGYHHGLLRRADRSSESGPETRGRTAS